MHNSQDYARKVEVCKNEHLSLDTSTMHINKNNGKRTLSVISKRSTFEQDCFCSSDIQIQVYLTVLHTFKG